MGSRGGPWLVRLARLGKRLIGRCGFFSGRGGVIHHILKFFAGFEVGNLLGWDVDTGSGLRISSYAGLPLARAEAAEAADLDFVAAAQGLHDAVEDGLDDDLRLFAGHFDYARDLLNQIRLGHVHASLKPRKTMFPQQVTVRNSIAWLTRICNV